MNLRIKAILHLAVIAGVTLAAFCQYGSGLALLVAFVLLQCAAFSLNPNPYALGAAANQLGTLAATGVLHDALGITLKRLPFLKRLASNIAPEMAERMMPFNVQQILKNYNANFQVYDRSQVGTYQVQQGVVLPADQTFTLNNWPAISIKLSATEVNTMVDTYSNKDARQIAINKLLQRAFNAFALNIVTQFLAVITAGNFPNNYASAVGTMTFKTLGSAVDALLALDALNPMAPPSTILEMVCFREFANSLTPLLSEKIVDEVVGTGVYSEPCSGAEDVTRYNLVMPADAPRGVLFDPAAIVFANRVPYEEIIQNSNVYLEVITDPDTGFSILYREAKDPMSGEVTRTITTLFGFAVGLNNHLIRITTV